MKYSEARECLYRGMIIKSEQCMYIRVCDKVYWCWLGDPSWRWGGETLNMCINSQEENENWEVVLDIFDWR